jgi:hypothetical protein
MEASHSKETENIHPHSSGNKNFCPGTRFFNPCPKHDNEHTKPSLLAVDKTQSL